MDIRIHWGAVSFDKSRRKIYENKFESDFQTLFEKDPKIAHVRFESYINPLL